MSDDNDVKKFFELSDLFQERLIKPALDQMGRQLDDHLKQMDVKLDGLVAKVDKHEGDIATLKKFQSGLLKGAAVYATAVGLAVGAAYGWIKNHFTMR